MQEEIICKYWNKKYSIGIDSSNNVLSKLDDGRIVPCDKVVHMGSIHYRPRFTNKRISSKMLNDKNELVKNYVLQSYCPF